MSQTRLAKVNGVVVPKTLWNGEHRQFFTWKASLIKDLRSEGLESCIRPNFPIPVIPRAAIDAVEDGRGTPAQMTLAYQYQAKVEQNDIKCQKALGMLTSTIGADVEQRYDHIISADRLSDRKPILP